jgi:kumamolisin
MRSKNCTVLVTLAVMSLFLAFLASTVAYAQAEHHTLLTRHVREAVVNGQAQLVGRLPATQSLYFDVVLPLRDPAGLETFLQELYDPSSPSFHAFLTPEEFTARFGPSQEDWDALIAFAKASGFEIVGGTRDGRDLWLNSTVASIEQAFHVTMGVYQHPTEDRTFYGFDREPTVDLPFQLWHISGLDNYSIPRPALVHRNIEGEPNATTGSGPSASFLGSDMRAAYYCNGTCGSSALTGAGQNIALLELAGTDLADLTTYYKNVGQTEPYTPTLISTGGYSTNCLYSGSSPCDDTEQTLDMTQAMGMAPGSKMLYMYVCGNGSSFSDSACLSAMVSTTDAPLSKQISCSWGWRPADNTTDDPYFKQMASQGQNFFVASGDDSAWSSSYWPYPAEDANVVAVGGTDLTTSSAAGPWASETAWEDSGGGISPDDIPIPSWQQLSGVITSSNKGSKVYRNGPDVAANANWTFYVCADQTTCTANEYGGTSFAAPMWAGYLALANQQATTEGETIGYINPIIYPDALTSSYSTLFHDITSGSCGTYSAVTDYDLCTGWGSPNGSGLINSLAPAAPVVTITPASGNFGQHFYGDPPAHITFTLKNTGTAVLNKISFGQLYDPFEFTSTTCGSSLGVGASCTFILTFVPADAPDGTSTENFLITDNAPNSPQSVPLTGKMSCPGGECP